MLPQNCNIKNCHRPAYTKNNGYYFCNGHALQNGIIPNNKLKSNHGHKKITTKQIKTFVLNVKKV